MKIIITTIFLSLLLFTGNSQSSTTTIQVGGFAFNPSSVTVTAGDTVKWMWNDGSHTTTSTSVPAGATSWNSPLNSSSTSFTYVVTTAGQYSYQCNFHFSMGMVGTITVNPNGIVPISGTVPEKFMLYQNFPNPFNPSTNIKFDIAHKTNVVIEIFDITGGKVTTLANTSLDAGSYSVDWDASANSSGLYFYRITTDQYSATRKMILVK